MNSRGLSWLEIENTPEVPGLYAWYLKLRFGKADRNSPGDWKSQMYQYIEQHKRPGMNIDAKAPLGLQFQGIIEHNILTSDDIDQQLSSDFKEIELISNILGEAAPHFASPLYIGIASKSLNQRLMSHKRLINRLRDQKELSNTDFAGEANAAQREADKTFASRVVARNIDVNHLIVYIVEVDTKSYSSTQINEALRSAEYLINRIYHPVLGRR